MRLIFEEPNYSNNSAYKAIKPIEYEINEITGCWNCYSHGVKDGYPQVKRNNNRQSVHRYIWTQLKGPIPKGLLVRHKCDNRLCINPNHLELGTISDNMQDRYQRGGYDTMKRLTEEQIRNIKFNTTMGCVKLSKKYGISETTVLRIRNGREHKDIV